ncbi:MAG: hypothetical protein HYV60_21665 [Planctomycetia bacterium]|nr:hypothetical protein [Planctomycetia bacterium]
MTEDRTKWMNRVVTAVEIPCWIAVVILAIVAGTFNFALAAIAGVVLLCAAVLIWWRVHRDLRAIKDFPDEKDMPKE